MTNQNIGIIGAGNMGSSLIGGLIADGLSPNTLWVCDPNAEKINALAKQYSIHTSASNDDIIENCPVIILAVKPQTIKALLTDIAVPLSQHQPLIISIAAGITEPQLHRWCQFDCAIVRCMPNTPTLVRSGATALFANKYVSAEQKAIAESILQSVGITVWLEDETLLDTVTALSGSGPAYFFFVMESLVNAAVTMGLPKECAETLASQTCLGAAKMAMESKTDLTTLRNNVTSKGGTTESALNVLKKADIESLFSDAMQAAATRAKTLSKENDDT